MVIYCIFTFVLCSLLHMEPVCQTYGDIQHQLNTAFQFPLLWRFKQSFIFISGTFGKIYSGTLLSEGDNQFGADQEIIVKTVTGMNHCYIYKRSVVVVIIC